MEIKTSDPVYEWASRLTDQIHDLCLNTPMGEAPSWADINGIITSEPNPNDCTIVPNSALRWLFGEEGDFAPPEVIDGMKPSYAYRKRGNYWWRGIFREKIAEFKKQSVPNELEG